MKRSMSLVLAVSMLAGMAATAFAETETPTTPDYQIVPVLFELDDDGTYVPVADGATMTEYGQSYAVPVITDLSKSDMAKFKAYAEWDLGSDIISDLKLDYAKFDLTSLTPDTDTYATIVTGDKTYTHAIVFNTKESSSTAVKDVSGKVTVAKTSTAAKNEFADADGDYVAVVGELSNSDIWYKNGTEGQDNVFDDDVMDIEFLDGEIMFTVDTKGQGNLNLAMNTKFNSEFAALYPEANLDFYTWTATPTFNRTGTLAFYVENSDENPSFIYEVTADGAKEVNAEYDEDLEAYTLKTRKLAKYVVSDVELSEIVEDAPEVEEPTAPTPSKPNPDTGR